MSKLQGVLELEVTRDRALAACREVFADLAWEMLVDEGGVIVAREDATALPCHCQPANSELRIDGREHGGASITIETRVPGFGPISSSQARDRQAGIVRRIHARATGSPLG
jgi:hypothetical protein